MNYKLILAFMVLLSAQTVFSQERTLWVTYGSSSFMHHPGIEACFPIWRQYNMQLGIAGYIRYGDKQQFANFSDRRVFNFHSANLGINRVVYSHGDHSLGLYVGSLLHYGPHFILLYQSEVPEENIYFDGAHYIPRLALDLGLYYKFKKLSVIAKGDTRRRIIRIGVGYSFSPSKEK